jgi:hypothetical protein
MAPSAVAVIYILLLRQGIPGWLAALITAIVYWVAPFPAMIMSGMEHILHFLVSITVITFAVEIIETNTPSSRQSAALLVGLALLTAVRYEGIFLAGIVIGLLVWRRFYRLALGGFFTGAFPLA